MKPVKKYIVGNYYKEKVISECFVIKVLNVYKDRSIDCVDYEIVWHDGTEGYYHNMEIGTWKFHDRIDFTDTQLSNSFMINKQFSEWLFLIFLAFLYKK